MTATEAPVVSAPQVQDGKSTVKEVKKPEEVQEEATTFLTTGKRNLLVKDIPAAVSDFAQACELLSPVFGITGKECAESYYYYGKALLEMSRLVSGVLGNALDGVPEEDDDANNSKVEDPSKMTEEEKKEVEEKVGEALKENLVELEKKDDEPETEEDGKVDTNEGEKVNDGADKADENQEEEGEDEGMDEGGESQEESSNEQMETDKVTKEDDEKTAGKDGEEEPSNLLSKAKDDIRLVAESYYQLGVTVAVESLKVAIQIIKEKNINVLVKSSEDKKEAVELEASIYKKEIEESEELIPEIDEKAAVESLNFAIQIIKERSRRIGSFYIQAEKSSSEAKATGDVKSVSTIAVKRKAEVDESQSKKTNSAEKTAAAV